MIEIDNHIIEEYTVTRVATMIHCRILSMLRFAMNCIGRLDNAIEIMDLTILNKVSLTGRVVIFAGPKKIKSISL